MDASVTRMTLLRTFEDEEYWASYDTLVRFLGLRC
ncbi:hypothetical protein JOF56_009568 [Kibdelosporangium banguiense]|uniref:Uncharacterized protein n=1 Tax=Kibdelosporangium banguiense TaxID=1365924 RepID=A0ABS4TYV5_9PSEU|nr:hypothetical protein [Kibdelosporangium banguiense]